MSTLNTTMHTSTSHTHGCKLVITTMASSVAFPRSHPFSLQQLLSRSGTLTVMTMMSGIRQETVLAHHREVGIAEYRM